MYNYYKIVQNSNIKSILLGELYKMNNKIIKIVVCLLVFGAVTGSCYGYSKTLKDDEYVNIMNNYIGEMKSCTEHQGGSLFKSLFGNIDDNYLVPEIDKQKLLLSGISGLKENISTLKLRNKDTKERHQEIMNKYTEVINLLDKDIKVKKDTLNKKVNDSDKYKMITNIDPDIQKTIDKRFYEIGIILQNINVEKNSK
jgi:hypothetical protein